MTDQAKTQEGRKLYRKPKIERVRLVPGEAVLQFCKTNLTPNAGGQTGVGCETLNCQKDGS